MANMCVGHDEHIITDYRASIWLRAAAMNRCRLTDLYVATNVQRSLHLRAAMLSRPAH
tara:strand:- start:177 stop:350 length:174 start_codon:yes stop_codon:yes gene_type:complete